MAKLITVSLICLLGLSTAIPANPILRKLDPLRFQHVIDSNGYLHLADLWMTLGDVAETTRYNPELENQYHLFTRSNPTLSQPLTINNQALLQLSSYDNSKRTIVLIHGWRNNAMSDFNAILVPAFLAAEDVNVIVVDWSAGAGTINYPAAVSNTVTSAVAVAAFIDWLNEASGSQPVQYHIVGHGLGGHQAGLVGRRVTTGTIGYITGLDPSLVGWINNNDAFLPDDGLFTEVIHTNSGILGYLGPLAQVDFYPNGGESMPGCDSHSCDHAMSIFYFAESLTSGGFTGNRCISHWTAILQQCSILPGTLQMGGLRPKFGSTGVFLVVTNAAPPFSRG